jgi:hypothetical protein
MTTSGTATFTYNRDQIIKMAYRKLGVINASETPSSQLVQDASDALNLWVKALNATGLHIWTEEEATLFLQPGQVSYAQRWPPLQALGHLRFQWHQRRALARLIMSALALIVDRYSGRHRAVSLRALRLRSRLR